MLASQPSKFREKEEEKTNEKSLRFDSKILFMMAISTMSTNTRTRTQLIVFVSSQSSLVLSLPFSLSVSWRSLSRYKNGKKNEIEKNKLINKYAIIVCDLCPKFTNKTRSEPFAYVHKHTHTRRHKKAHLNQQRNRRKKTIAKIKPKQTEKTHRAQSTTETSSNQVNTFF